MPKKNPDLPNAHWLEHDIISSGQPSETQLRAAQQSGIRTVVNLRPEAEFSASDEAEIATHLGMHYVHIPIAGAADLTDTNADKLDQALSAEGATPAIVHCASGNRVGALLAYRAHHNQGQSREQALQIGVDAGLQPDSPLYTATRQALS